MRSVLMAILWISMLSLKAQTYSISGKVRAMEGAALTNATITLRAARDSGLVRGTVSDSSGSFMLLHLTPGNYLLQVSAVGMHLYSRLLELGIADLSLQDIRLLQDSTVSLQEVTVTAQRSFLRREVDRLVVDIEHSVYSKGENGMRLINIIPGMQLDGLGNIVFRGGENVTVYVDNRKLPFTGQQLLNYLKSIPSESIKTYEVRSIGGAQFDADNTGAIIDIILKNDYRYGLSGSVGAEYQYTRYHNMSNWLLLNYRVSQFTFQLASSLYVGRQFDEQTETQYYKSTGVYSFQDNNTINHKILYNNYKIGVDYRITNKQIITANFENTRFPYHPLTSSINRFAVQGRSAQTDSIIFTSNSKDVRQRIEQASIFYRNKLNSNGSVLDMGYSYVSYTNYYNSSIATDYQYPADPQKDYRDSLFISNPLSIRIHTGNIDLQKVLKHSFILEGGTKLNVSSTDNDISYFRAFTAGGAFDSLRSNHFIYDERIIAFYGGLTKHWNAWSMKMGVRAENTHYKGYAQSKPGDYISRNLWSFFPTLFVQRKFNPANSLTFAYSRSTNRPSYQLLNPFENIENPFYIEKGNPKLLPFFTHSLELSYLLHSKYNFTLGYKRTDKSVNAVYENAGTVVVSTYGNLSNADNAFFFTSLPVKVCKWWEINNSLTLRYVRLDINEVASHKVREKFSQAIWISNRLTLPKGFFVEVVGRYGRNQFLGIYDWDPQGSIDINFKKGLFSDKLMATLNLADPFNLKRIGWKVDETQFTRQVFSRIPTRYVSIGLSYNFSRGKKDTSREGIERKDSEEVNRLNR